MENYLGNPTVRTALGVALDADFFSADNGNGFVYNTSMQNVLPIYQRALAKGIRVMMFNGDT